MNPLFSIITVTRNAADTIGRTLQSVAEQSFELYELVVQDGASTDGTLAMVEAARRAGVRNISVVSEPDGGIYDGMNRAMERAKGDYLIFLNAGDSLHSPDTLELLAQAVFDNDYPGIAYGRTDIVDIDGRRLGPRHLEPPEQLTVRSFSAGMLVCHQAMVVLAKIAPRYDLSYRFSADYDWAIRAIENSRRNLFIDRVIVDYLNEGTTTRNHRASLMERYRIMCRYYGTIPTLARHVGFALRALRRKFKPVP